MFADQKRLLFLFCRNEILVLCLGQICHSILERESYLLSCSADGGTQTHHARAYYREKVFQLVKIMIEIINEDSQTFTIYHLCDEEGSSYELEQVANTLNSYDPETMASVVHNSNDGEDARNCPLSIREFMVQCFILFMQHACSVYPDVARDILGPQLSRSLDAVNNLECSIGSFDALCFGLERANLQIRCVSSCFHDIYCEDLSRVHFLRELTEVDSRLVQTLKCQLQQQVLACSSLVEVMTSLNGLNTLTSYAVQTFSFSIGAREEVSQVIAGYTNFIISSLTNSLEKAKLLVDCIQIRGGKTTKAQKFEESLIHLIDLSNKRLLQCPKSFWKDIFDHLVHALELDRLIDTATRALQFKQYQRLAGCLWNCISTIHLFRVLQSTKFSTGEIEDENFTTYQRLMSPILLTSQEKADQSIVVTKYIISENTLSNKKVKTVMYRGIIQPLLVQLEATRYVHTVEGLLHYIELLSIIFESFWNQIGSEEIYSIINSLIALSDGIGGHVRPQILPILASVQHHGVVGKHRSLLLPSLLFGMSILSEVRYNDSDKVRLH